MHTCMHKLSRLQLPGILVRPKLKGLPKTPNAYDAPTLLQQQCKEPSPS
jgi:hypothetical protein